MTAKQTDITTYTPIFSDAFFFDNNVWMYLFCPLGDYNKKRQRHYSNFLKSVQNSGGSIYISSMVLSEFANRSLRMDFEQWKEEYQAPKAKYKNDYIGSERYAETVKEIRRAIEQIISICVKAPDNFSTINLDNIFNHFSAIDFNDSYFIELASMSRWKLVTDDQDFIKYSNHSIEVVTIIS